MSITKVEFEHQGNHLVSQMVVPDGPGPHPAVILVHDARGLGSEALRRLPWMKDLGYVGYAVDMYGDGEFAENGDAGHLMFPLLETPGKLRDRIIAHYEWLKARPEVDPNRIAAIGFCFGGQCVLELARSGADAKVVVSYHGLLTTQIPAETGKVTSYVMAYHADEDLYAPFEHLLQFRDEMRAAKARWEVSILGDVYHQFTDPNAAVMETVPGVIYDPLADSLSWQGTLRLFDELMPKPA